MTANVRNLSFMGKDGQRVANAQSGNFNIVANGESLMIDGEWGGHTQAPVTTTLSLDTLVVVEDDSAQMGFINSLINKTYTGCIAGIAFGKLWTWEVAKCTEFDCKWDNESGSATGSLKFEAGKPKIT